jgi:ADP-heptose:LPS heptosyltransferase
VRSEGTGRLVVLTLRALGLGDFLTAIPAFRAVARAFPDHRRIAAIPEPLAPLALHTGAAEEVLPHEGLRPLPSTVRPPKVAVNLHGRGPESHRVLLATGALRLLGFFHPRVPESRGMPTWKREEHEVARWCRLLSEVGIPADPDDLHFDPPPRPAPSSLRGVTVLHPGAARGSRRWPAERWAAVARAEGERGQVVITGGRAEIELARRVARLAGLADEAVVAGRTDLLELAAIVAAAHRVVSGDTGVAHLATALRKPSVILFGPTSPQLWGPPEGEPRHVPLWKGAIGDPLSDEPDRGLLDIQPEEVIEALASLPGDGKAHVT